VGELLDEIDEAAQIWGFSGVIHVDRPKGIAFSRAYGMSDRTHHIPITTDTIFSMASATKSLTALVIMRLVETGVLDLSTVARDILGRDLPQIDDLVTVEQLLSHRSGIGDYLDESTSSGPNEYVMTIPVHRLSSAEAYLEVLGERGQKFPPGERFEYCNSGYAVLAILAERASTATFAQLLSSLVTQPAAMPDTGFIRMDELPSGVARGYLEQAGLRSNVLHLPVLGTGDGGSFSTLHDISCLWESLFDGRIVSGATREEMLRRRGHSTQMRCAYGLGFWLPDATDAVMIEGADAGVSIRSVFWPEDESSYSVISNTSTGAWPLVRIIQSHLSI
jgi:CubicO group peptidase (beta-lactamase class C family)